ncbi:MAG: HEPN domain-containing protein [bacterium]|nr:HEPN domain-containing protein [bacterium]
MNNLDFGKELIEEAKKIFQRDLSLAFAEGSYNLVVRRAQEVVELLLKGFLKIGGIEYPRIHDVGEVFAVCVLEKLPAINKKDLAKIKGISTNLAKLREPSFYFERIYTKEDAQKAKNDARFCINLIETLLPSNVGTKEDENPN